MQQCLTEVKFHKILRAIDNVANATRLSQLLFGISKYIIFVHKYKLLKFGLFHKIIHNIVYCVVIIFKLSWILYLWYQTKFQSLYNCLHKMYFLFCLC